MHWSDHTSAHTCTWVGYVSHVDTFLLTHTKHLNKERTERPKLNAHPIGRCTEQLRAQRRQHTANAKVRSSIKRVLLGSTLTCATMRFLRTGVTPPPWCRWTRALNRSFNLCTSCLLRPGSSFLLVHEPCRGGRYFSSLPFCTFWDRLALLTDQEYS